MTNLINIDESKQQWKPVEGHENYQISNMGRWKRTYKNGVVHISYGKNKGTGYKQLEIYENGKIVDRYLIHDLVVQTFVRKFDRATEQCHHKNHFRNDNRLQNLQIVDKHTHRSKDEQTNRRRIESKKNNTKFPTTIELPITKEVREETIKKTLQTKREKKKENPNYGLPYSKINDIKNINNSDMI